MKKLVLFVVVMFTAYLSWAQWEPDIRLTVNSSSSLLSYNKNANDIYANNDTLSVVWTDNRDGNFEIYFKRSTDKGLTWGPDTRLTNDPGISLDPCIAVFGSFIFVSWSDTRDGNVEIYFKRSTDKGLTWGPDMRLTNAAGQSGSPCLAINDSVMHVSWWDARDAIGPNDSEIYSKRSTDKGLTWGPDIRLTNATDYSGLPGVAVSGSMVHIIWEDHRDGNGEIYYKRSTDEGLNWGPDIRLTNNAADSWDPCISAKDSVLHIVWEDNRDGNYEIYYKHSTDGGLTWCTDTRLTNAPGDSKFSTVASSGSMVHVVWQDNRDGNFEVYYKQSTDGGLNWGTDIRLTNALDDSQYPFLALSDSIVHVAWFDKRDGNYEIYYKRNPTGGVPTGVDNSFMSTSNTQINIFPNPASNIIHIRFNNYSNENTVLTISNILGEELLKFQIQNSETVIGVSRLPNGLFFAGITTRNNKVFKTKFMIVKD